MFPSLRSFFFILAGFVCAGQAISARPAAENATAPRPPIIVIGFVGGYVSHTNAVHAEVQLIAQLAKEYPTEVVAEAFENHRGEQAHQEILRLLDTDDDGKLSPQEKQNARIIIYGHSWGASEAVTLARQLERDGIPVLLTVQVDSIGKRGEDDSVIPSNVAQAVNFYQPDGPLHGRAQIRAADPARTQIIGNYRFDYKGSSLTCEQYPWWDRYFVKAHTQIECDPKVWAQIDSLIRSRLPSPTRTASLGN
ncbi:MAG: hypothetical protein WB780_04650 [Candidatus Acidiferrales bacterium]